MDDEYIWEVEIKIRRKGRLVRWERSFGPDPDKALYAVHNDLELWAQAEVLRIEGGEAP